MWTIPRHGRANVLSLRSYTAFEDQLSHSEQCRRETEYHRFGTNGCSIMYVGEMSRQFGRKYRGRNPTVVEISHCDKQV
jgi:hypothetical protein